MQLGLYEYLHMYHRFWRYRFRSEVNNIRYVRHADLQGQTVLDIGANRGIYSYYLSRQTGPNGKVFSFEAQPELGEHLEKLKADFKLDNVTIVPCGLSSKPGVLTLHRSKVGSGHASFQGEAGEGETELQIETITVDGFLADKDVGRITFVKCDVEGHEVEVLRGAEETLRKHQPTVLMEMTHENAEDGTLFRQMSELGYRGHFYHVTRENHANIFRKHIGKWVPAEQFDQYEYVREGIDHRDYFFLPEGQQPTLAEIN